jgi:hypothetical protein
MANNAESDPNKWSLLNDYSKTVVTLASALLAATVTFADKLLLLSSGSGIARYALYCIWVFLFLSIASALYVIGRIHRHLRDQDTTFEEDSATEEGGTREESDATEAGSTAKEGSATEDSSATEDGDTGGKGGGTPSSFWHLPPYRDHERWARLGANVSYYCVAIVAVSFLILGVASRNPESDPSVKAAEKARTFVAEWIRLTLMTSLSTLYEKTMIGTCTQSLS